MTETSISEKKIVVGLDIGTTKICAVAAEVSEEETCIIGFGQAISEGLNRGVVTNIRSAKKSIKKAIEECQLKAGFEIESVHAGIAGHHIQGLNRDGVVAVTGETITSSDIQRVIESARACNFPDKEILHTLCQEYIVDGQDGVIDPIGMAGKRLEAKVHLILGSVSSAANIVLCCNDAGLHVENVVLEPLASSLAALEDEEKELGVVLLDIGGGTTDLVIYRNAAISHTSVLPLGGNQVTSDIAIGLRTTRIEALRLKHEYGVADVSMCDKNDVITIKGIAGREDRILERRLLAEVIEARFREIFELIKKDLQKSEQKPGIAAGIVLTGGSSLLKGIEQLAEEVLEMPVRIGAPSKLQGLNEMVESPIYSTAVGLIKYGADSNLNTTFLKNANPDSLLNNVTTNLKGIIKNFFKLF